MKLSLVKILENIAKENKSNGKMVCVWIPPNIGSEIQEIFSDIEGDAVEPEDMHITIGLIREDDDEVIFRAMKEVVGHISQFNVSIDGFGNFDPNPSNENKIVLWAKPNSEELPFIHKKVFEVFGKHGIEIDNGNFDWSPHITIKYCKTKPNTSMPFKKDFRVNNLGFASLGKRFKIKIND